MFGDVIKKLQRLVGYDPKPADGYDVQVEVDMSKLETLANGETKTGEASSLIDALRLEVAKRAHDEFQATYPSSGKAYGGCDSGVYNRDLAISNGAVPAYTMLENKKKACGAVPTCTMLEIKKKALQQTGTYS